jgi:DNA-binding transcriptional LysR family regulator
MSLEQLAVLDAIEREGSFAAASRATHRSPTAVTYAVQGLEEALGLTLFDRSGHRAVLTDAGRLVLAEARQILDRTRALDRMVRLLREDWEPALGLVVDGAIPLQPVWDAVRSLANLGAPTRIRVHVEHLSGVQTRFLADPADVMVALDLVPDPSLATILMDPVVFFLVAHRDHPLAGRVSVGRSDLASYVELRVADSGRSALDQPGRLSLDSPHVIQVSDFSTKLQAIRAKVGFGWMPEHLLLGIPDVVDLAFTEGARALFTPSLATRSDRLRGRALRHLLRVLRPAGGDGPG